MREWNEFIAALADAVGGIFMLAFLSLLATALVAMLWYFWPRWLPHHWALFRWRRDERDARAGRRGGRRLGSLRFRWRWRLRWRRRRRRVSAPDELAPDELPDLPAQVLSLSADDLASAGRYAEAVRERLRAMVRELVDREVVPLAPGWTVTELARAAMLAQPPLGPPLAGAVDVFSRIWYGLVPATADDDAAMRVHAAAVSAHLAPMSATVGAPS